MQPEKENIHGLLAVTIVALIICEIAVVFIGFKFSNLKSVSAGVVYESDVGSDIPKIERSAFEAYNISSSGYEYAMERLSEIEKESAVPPFATVVDYKAWRSGEASEIEYIEPFLFVTNIGGGSGDISVSYKTEPDFSQLGLQEIVILLTDVNDSNNVSELTARLEIEINDKPPTITGAKDLTVYAEDKAVFGKDVTISGNENLNLTVDYSYANLSVPGIYNVIYKADDGENYIASAVVKINVKPRPIAYDGLDEKELSKLDELNAMVDTLLSNIIKDDMTKEEALRAVYKWGRSNIAYVGTSEKTSWVDEAINGIKRKRGDCFTYFSVAKAMLTRMGIENIDVVKSDTSRSSHYWSMVNAGNGWYHFDATPRHNSTQFFMLTDEELMNYSIKNNNTHIFDQTLYPPTPYAYEGIS